MSTLAQIITQWNLLKLKILYLAHDDDDHVVVDDQLASTSDELYGQMLQIATSYDQWRANLALAAGIVLFLLVQLTIRSISLDTLLLNSLVI